MAFTFQFNQLPCKTLSLNPPQPHLISKPSILSIGRAAAAVAERKSAISARPSFKIRAEESDEEAYGDDESAAVAVAAEEKEPAEETDVSKLKKTLVDLCYKTERGTQATSVTRAEIVELIMQLEAKNPTPAPTEALSLLNGKWILMYTSFSAMFPLLSKSTVPYLKVEEISQTFDSECFTVQNAVLFAGPLATTSVSACAKFEILSPQRVHVKFEEGIIGTPVLTDSIDIPENVEFLGQNLDLSSFTGVMSSVQDSASNVRKTISSQPPIKFTIPATSADSWMLTTYLDEDLRISREDDGKLFVLLKAGCHLLCP